MGPAATSTGANLDSRLSDADEVALIQRIAKKRDASALEQLHSIYAPRLAKFLCRLTSNRADIEEVCNDVLWAVWKQAHAFKGNSKVSTWIFSIAYRICIKVLRKSAWRPEDNGEVFDNVCQTKVDENITEDDTSDLMQLAIKELSPKHRMVVELSYFLDRSYDEIAQIADCPVNTVKTRMFHARRQLKDIVIRLS